MQVNVSGEKKPKNPMMLVKKEEPQVNIQSIDSVPYYYNNVIL